MIVLFPADPEAAIYRAGRWLQMFLQRHPITDFGLQICAMIANPLQTRARMQESPSSETLNGHQSACRD